MKRGMETAAAVAVLSEEALLSREAQAEEQARAAEGKARQLEKQNLELSQRLRRKVNTLTSARAIGAGGALSVAFRWPRRRPEPAPRAAVRLIVMKRVGDAMVGFLSVFSQRETDMSASKKRRAQKPTAGHPGRWSCVSLPPYLFYPHSSLGTPL